MLSPGFGLGRYVQQLVKHLQAIDTKNQYILFLKADNWKEVEESENFKKVLTDIPWYSWQEQTKLKKIIKKENVDLMHFPHWNVPLSYHDPFVVTIHDLIMYHFPRPQATTRSRIVFWLKDKIHRMVIRHAVEKASRVIATSEFTKGDVVKTLHIAESKITVVYQAPFIDDAYRASPITYHDIQKKYSITEPYVLYVGAAYPHKNLERLVDAWKLFEEKYGENYQLVLVGKEDYFYKRLKSGIKAGESKIIFTGFASGRKIRSPISIMTSGISVAIKRVKIFFFTGFNKSILFNIKIIDCEVVI